MTADCLAKTQFLDPNGHPAHPACPPPTAIKPALSECYRRSESHVGRLPKTQCRPNSDPNPTQSGLGMPDNREVP